MTETWRLKRTRQCDKCPWRKDADPYDIPNYSAPQHAALASTIAEHGSLSSSGRVMSCHEHSSGDGVYCVGWLAHQLGQGNNIPLRMHMSSCENAGSIRLIGEQHETFEETLPDDWR